MCGIAGYFSPGKFFSENDLQKMTTAVAHRGPDSHGYYTDELAGLGHRRLSILDLSARGNQPMHSHNGRYVIIYNGEVYNYREIAASLKNNLNDVNINFNSSSDTEVILESFVQKGLSAINELNGMFAFAIYDKQEQEMYIVRDRIGIKPLYYYWDGENFAFGSELKTLTGIGQIKKEIEHAAIVQYLHLGMIPAPLTIYKNIYKLEPGTVIRLNRKGIEFRKYWSPNLNLSDTVVTSEKQAMVQLADLLMSSVQYQLRSDVPFGIFLSGGIDSSLIAVNAVNVSGVKINTFSIGFSENKFNESVYAKEVARYIGTQHHELIVSYKDAINLFDEILNIYDEPFADSSLIPTLLVSSMAKKHVTVALSGEGGDELFFGYGSHKWAQRLNNPLVRLMSKPLSMSLGMLSSRYKRVAGLVNIPEHSLLKSHIFSQEQYYFSVVELADILVDPAFDPNGFKKINELNINQLLKRKLNGSEEQALFDLNYYLPDDLLVKVDRASMHYSLETRVPFLDHRIVEFALNLSPKLKINNGVSKYLLKEILYQYIPKKYFERPKQGFSIPLENWLKSELNYLVQDYLNKAVVERAGMVKYEKVKQLVSGFMKGNNYLYNRIWQLIVLHKWFIDNEASPLHAA